MSDRITITKVHNNVIHESLGWYWKHVQNLDNGEPVYSWCWHKAGTPLTRENISAYCPHYTEDRDIIIPVVEALPYEQQPYYIDALKQVMMKFEGVSDFDIHNATAPDRCYAYLITIGKLPKFWKQ